MHKNAPHVIAPKNCQGQQHMQAPRPPRSMRRTRTAILLLVLLSLASCSTAMATNKSHAEPSHTTPDTVCVILLHGLGRTHRSMKKMALAIAAQGYEVNNLSYPSTKMNLKHLVALYLAPAVEKQRSQKKSVYFVTHSMGGILVRAYLQQYPDAPVERVVMLAPPNRGSEIIDYLGGSKLFAFIFGPAALQLSTAPDALVNTLPAPGVPTGIIAGTKSLNPISSFIIPGKDDGKVSVQRTQLAGAESKPGCFLQVPCAHTFLMNNPYVIQQTLEFLTHGSFAPDHP